MSERKRKEGERRSERKEREREEGEKNKIKGIVGRENG